MTRFLKRLPVPVSGLILGLAALGNLLGVYHPLLRVIPAGLSGLLLVLLLLKVLASPGVIRESLAAPVTAGALQTLPMAMVLLAGHLKPLAPGPSQVLWALGLLLCALLVLVFTLRHAVPLRMEKVFPTWFVLYVGIVVGSVTGPAFGLSGVGQMLFWSGLVVYLPLIPLVTWRVLKVGGIPAPAAPTLAIYAAPASLLLAGYLNAFPEKNVALVVFLMVLALGMTLFALSRMPALLRQGFAPAVSSYTFPFVISAIALRGSQNFLLQAGYPAGFLAPVVWLEILWAVAMVLYVAYGYLKNVLYPAPAPGPGAQAA